VNVKEYNESVDSHADGLYRFALKSLNDTGEAEDLVQDAFAKLWMKRDQVDANKAKSYLFTTVYHAIIDRSRKQKRIQQFEQSVIPEFTSPSTHFDLKHQLDQALNVLPEYQRTAVLLRDYEGYSYQEIGEITGLSTEQVKVYIFRARKALRTYLVSLEQLL
jgi:RNA polymerase sigma-70 factor (ECF subfamily)